MSEASIKAVTGKVFFGRTLPGGSYLVSIEFPPALRDDAMRIIKVGHTVKVEGNEDG